MIKHATATETSPFVVPNWLPHTPVLRQWDPQEEEHRLPVDDGFFIIVEGSRRIGKSVFLKWLLQFYADEFDLAVVMTETPMTGFWQPIVGNKWVHYGYNPFLVMQLIEEQIAERQKVENASTFGDGPTPRARHVLLILDDIIGQKRIHYDDAIQKLATQGRHFYISVVLTTQDPKAISPQLRQNTDIAVIFQQKSFRAKESVYNDFLNKFRRKDEAVALMNRYTKNHDCIVVEMFKLDSNVTDMYFYLPESVPFDKEADRINAPDYQIGCPEQKLLAQTPRGSMPLPFSVKI
jgi:hypothetical protein